MMRLTRRTLAAFGMSLVLVACNQIAGIHEATLRGEGGSPVVPCSTVADCTVEEPECRTATCEGGTCVFDDATDGTSLSAQRQTKGDCAEWVCDGTGKARLSALPTDVPDDDGNPCTLETCEGTEPKRTLQAQVACYTGPAETRHVGDCTDGVQQCDAQGNPVGGCVGEVLPGVETCLAPGDEDCNGKQNEGGEGCVCTPEELRDCYSGPPGTAGVGACHVGKQVCDTSGLGFGLCYDEQTPQIEICDANKVDENCDGQVDEGFENCTCGDGVVDPGEECDDGNTVDTDGCTTACKLAKCGDGLAQPGNGEECDDGNADDTDGCTHLCELPKCGDGFVQTGKGEECDDGNTDDTDACTNACKLPVCGDGVVQPGNGEECDDGNADNTDGCTMICKPPMCGDGFVQAALGEACDDGNADDTDGCTNACKLPVCGDGFSQPSNGEECDLGPLGGIDCSSTCTRPRVLLVEAYAHTCALLNDASVKCWGWNMSGQLGLGDLLDRGDQPGEMGDALPTVSLGTGKTATALGAGFHHTCALLNDGSVKCWGWNLSGQLGLGDKQSRGDQSGEMGDALPAVDLGTGKTAKAISAGEQHTCALLNDGSVKCWGSNYVGQLGLGDMQDRGDQAGEMGDALPTVDLGTGKTAKAISAGNNHTCALLNDGSVKCWGDNSSGKLGLGNAQGRGDQLGEMGDALPTVDLGTGKTATAISAGEQHTCALLNDGSVKCWGWNGYGELGLGDIQNRGDQAGEMGDALPAVDLGTGKTATAISVGGLHTCALLNDGSVKCWGWNGRGQLGLGDTQNRGDQVGEMGDALPAVDLGTGKTAKAISAGDNHMCALLNDGSVKCWGANGNGRLGLGDLQDRGDQAGEMGDALPTVKLFSSQW